MQEVVSKREIRSKTFDKGDGTFAYRAHTKPIHYVNSEDEIVDIDITLEDKGLYWEMTRNNYTLRVAKDFSAEWLISYRNKIKNWKTGTRANHQIKYEPKMLVWVNATDLSDMQVFRNQQAVQGVITGENNHIIRYENAFGDGIHFEITLKRLGFTKEVVIDALNKLEQPPTANHKLVALFKYDGVRLNDLAHLRVRDDTDQTEWDEDAYKESENGYEIGEDDAHRSLIKPAYIVDSTVDPQPNRQSIKVFWKRHNGFLWQAKVLPKQFLLNATYPVRADTTTTVYPDANTETDTFDGNTYGTWSTNWATARAAAAGANYSVDDYNPNSYMGVTRKNSSLGYIVAYGYHFFKYNIASGNTITAAEVGIYTKFPYDQDNDAYGYMKLCKHTRTTGSQTGVNLSDHAIAYFSDVLANDIDNTNLHTDTQYDVFTFTSGGLTQLTADGNDQYLHTGLVEGHTFDNVAPDSGANSENGMWTTYSAENTGTTKDPYLEITYSASASGPASLKTRDTIATASIKTVDTVAIASVKTIDTIT